ncbi:MAG: hypothetical protein ACI4J7_08790 [Ruminiclostridium sp.]
MENLMDIIYNGVLTVGISIVGFFLKRCFTQLDSKAEKAELEKTKDEIKEFRQQYATKEQVKEIQSQMHDLKNSIDFLKEETVRKNDFVRVTAEISGKIDDLSSYLRGKI